MRKIISLLSIVFLVGCLFVPLVNGEVVAWGNNAEGTGATFNANQVFTFNVSTAGLVDSDYTVDYAMAYLRDPSGTSNVKFLVFNSTLHIIGTSEPVEVGATLQWYRFNFSVAPEIEKSQNYYYIGIVSDSTLYWYRQTTAETDIFIYDTTNSYAVPGSITDAVTGDTYKGSFYLMVYSTGSATPTPAPSATTSTSDEGLQYWSDLLMPWLPVMLVILVPAFLMLKYLGQFGFFVGLNIGVLVAYVVLGSAYVPLWGVVLVGVLDIALVLMRR